jgi:hypothetical protein
MQDSLMNRRLQTVLALGITFLGIVYFAINGEDEHTNFPARAQSTPTKLTFHGYDCTIDCSGHEAGYNCAEEHDITDEEDCAGDSESFVEGCKAYVKEQQGISHESDGEDDPDSDE